ncbi:triose-phosphate isomerase [Candidatus Saccharibacteria bacterium]|nr:triose-phosphate isomerase [Candidatus Saccharibacteria bacterium]
MKTYIVGNWKMNFTVGEASIYLHKLQKRIKSARGLEVVVAPSSIALQSLSLQLTRKNSKIRLAAQNIYHKDYGAYTGETSVAQIKDLVKYVIIGHSERRYVFHETDKDIRQKVAAALRAGLTPILCVGETENERTYNETADVLRDQIYGGLSEVAREDIKKCIIAYEPVWAISGTGHAKLATPDEVAEAVKLIKNELRSLYGEELTKEVPILYGGSVAPSNAGAYLTVPGVSGLLIGGASLIADQFVDIIEIAKKVKS